MQVVIALVVTPEGFPLAYEVLPGNTTDKSTLRDFLKKIENQYGRARRVWVMDRGIPTEAVEPVTPETVQSHPELLHELLLPLYTCYVTRITASTRVMRWLLMAMRL